MEAKFPAQLLSLIRIPSVSGELNVREPYVLKPNGNNMALDKSLNFILPVYNRNGLGSQRDAFIGPMRYLASHRRLGLIFFFYSGNIFLL